MLITSRSSPWWRNSKLERDGFQVSQSTPKAITFCVGRMIRRQFGLTSILDQSRLNHFRETKRRWGVWHTIRRAVNIHYSQPVLMMGVWQYSTGWCMQMRSKRPKYYLLKYWKDIKYPKDLVGIRVTVGVMNVEFHPKQPWVFSCGADGTVKLWTSWVI